MAFLETGARAQVGAALERSRSGRGGHVWLFFDEAVPAALARRLGSHLLTEAMERTLSGTKNRFRLNADLPIAFDSLGGLY